jgi:hypothetical protein
LLALVLLAGPALADAPSLDYPGGSITYETHGSRTTFLITTSAGKHYRIRLPRDSNVARGTPPRQVALVGQLDPDVIILTDSYPSIPGGLEYCEAGEEKFLRVISLAAGSALQTYHVKLESCRQNVQLATSGLDWQPEARTLSIHWTSGHQGVDKAENQTIKIGPRDVAVQHQ